MGAAIRFIYGTEAEILALQPTDTSWVERAFYYPEDKTYFFQALNGVMKRYGAGDSTLLGVGVQLDGKVIGGVKTLVNTSETLTIPQDYDYNTYTLLVNGTVDVFGQINIIQ